MKIVVVGGGAGGLELVTYLGRKLGKKKKAEVILIDRSPIHLWKPLLHEIASGSLDENVDAISYRAHAYQNHYIFKPGMLLDVNCQKKCVLLDAMLDEQGDQILPQREESYDYLVLAIGSKTHDFGITGVRQHCIMLDRLEQAHQFHNQLLNHFIRLDQELSGLPDNKFIHVAIVGGGATGVELSAELVKAREWFAIYGLKHIRPENFKISLIEAGDRLVPALSERLSQATQKELEKLGVQVHTGTLIEKINQQLLITSDGNQINADHIVWAAGIKAADSLSQIDGLKTNQLNQVIVDQDLRASGDDYIFALGDCAGFAITNTDNQTRWVPPRAQSAHQMASSIAKNLLRLLHDQPLKPFKYRDHGSLVSLSSYTAFGRLMGSLSKGSLSIEGRIARIAYLSLYRMHQIAIHGWFRTALISLSDTINRYIRPRIKLH